jgi:hypothetical protein
MQTEKISSKWPLVLAEIQEIWAKRGVDVLEASNAVELKKLFQRAGLSEQRSNHETEETLRRFQEKLRRAA